MRHAIVVGALTLAAFQGSRWKEIGKTSAGNSVYVAPKSVTTRNGIITADLQVKFATPVKVGNGEWRLSRHVAMFDCAKKTVAAKSTTYYADYAGTKVVERSAAKIPGFGPAIGGSMTQVALDYLCAKK